MIEAKKNQNKKRILGQMNHNQQQSFLFQLFLKNIIALLVAIF